MGLVLLQNVYIYLFMNTLWVYMACLPGFGHVAQRTFAQKMNAVDIAKKWSKLRE